MSKATGIKGYTPDRLRRAKDAKERQEQHASRSPAQQISLLGKRPGNSAKERKRLAALIAL